VEEGKKEEEAESEDVKGNEQPSASLPVEIISDKTTEIKTSTEIEEDQVTGDAS
jgi:hypothetical protein